MQSQGTAAQVYQYPYQRKINKGHQDNISGNKMQDEKRD